MPSLALAPLWGLTTYQLATRWQSEKSESDLTASLSRPSSVLFRSLEEERRLTAEARSDPGASTRDKLAAARAVTDRAVTGFRPVAAESTSHGQQGLSAALAATLGDLDRLPAQRKAVDSGSAGDTASYDFYSGTVDSLITVFTALGRSSNAAAALLAHTMVDLYSAIDMIGREDALLGRDWRTGHLKVDEYDAFVDAVGAQDYLLQRVALSLTGAERDTYKKLTAAKSWAVQHDLEEQIVVAGPHHSQGELVLGKIHNQWRGSVDANYPRLLDLALVRSTHLNKVSADSVNELQRTLVIISAVGLLAVILVILTSWRLTVTLRRRIHALREDAVGLQQRLPDVVSRLERGENVDVDREVRLVEPTPDELGELGRALNAASRSAVATAVRQAEQHRGFERLLQRIARRTQILIGLQLRKLDELERTHDDPDVLNGLFDLDHLTARLRRYEENLVILGGGQPQRRWHKPVQLLDVLRAAQGEVQDYRRIAIDVENEPWVHQRAVGALVHILAELMENAAAFSKPPTPVEVRAAVVGRGIAIEIEDRGLGMDPEQYAAANALMEAPPQLDVMTQADDVRLGLYVVARLSAGLGLRVELRPSAFGGTRVIVLLPEQVVVEPAGAGVGAGAGTGTEPRSGVLPSEGMPLRGGGGSAVGSSVAGGGSVAGGAGAGFGPAVGSGFGAEAGAGFGAEVGAEVGAGAGAGAGFGPAVGGGSRPQPYDGSVAGGPTSQPYDGSHDGSTGARAPYDGGVGAAQVPPDDGQLPFRSRGRAMANVTASAFRPPDGDVPTPPPAEAKPLPQRVRQASLAPELRLPAEPKKPDEPDLWTAPDRSGRSGATIGAFQRQSRLARMTPGGDHPDSGGTAGGSGGDGRGDAQGNVQGDAPGDTYEPFGERVRDSRGYPPVYAPGYGNDHTNGYNYGYGNGDASGGAGSGDGGGDGNGVGNGYGDGLTAPDWPGSPRTDDRE
ncbi:sensor histidine kinase [Streptomyces liangshanensis]|uniref:sensor histidine kinase n=1 Tax=Streptomyces liangshanensis TaxID=2717324 RepID=UPI001AAE6A93|nr:nitrate- and nitrite sensing domain-containing protein [Streptomyces liangshanensis]